MNDVVIRVENLGKQYRIGGVRGDLLSERLGNSLRSILRSFLHRNDSRFTIHDSRDKDFWALKDVSFEVRQGEVIGVIGRNGAGKSTLLKILSRITSPTKGRVEILGRVGSLLEVGTGFHPELTGRENIFLNGAILGMSKTEIRKKFDEIVAFAEIEKFVDTPVKHYSSGMYVRLAFAVAAHLEPEILIVDEVLAVGDAAFQKKCLGKMGDVAKEGRTVLFVSHNMSAVRNLCPLVLLLDEGCLKFYGATQDGLAAYERETSLSGDSLKSTYFQGPLSDQISVKKIVLVQEGSEVTVLDPLQDFEIEIHGIALRSFPVLELSIHLFRDGFHIASCYDTPPASLMGQGKFLSRFRIPAKVLRPGRYTVGLGATASIGDWIWGSDVVNLDFVENLGGMPAERNRGVVALPYTAERVQVKI